MPKALTNYDFQGFQAFNLRLQNLATAPGTLDAGRIYYDTAAGMPKWSDGTTYHGIYKASTSATPNTVALRDGSGAIAGAIVGAAQTADKWTTARQITLGTDLSGAVTLDGSANVTLNATIANGAVGLAKMANLATQTLVGRNTAGTGAPEALSASTVRGMLISAGTGVAISAGGAISIGQAVGAGDSPTFANLTVQNLTVNGTTTTVNSTAVTLDDPILTLGGDTAPTTDDGKDRGVEFRWHDGSLAKRGFFGFDRSTGKLTFISDATNTSEVFSGTKGTLDANVEWADILSKPDPTVTVSLSGDLAGSGNATLTDLGNGTIGVAATIAAGAVTGTKVAANGVTLDRLAQVAAKRLLGNASGSTANVAAVKLTHSQTIGGASVMDVVHGLGTTDVAVECFLVSTGEKVEPDVSTVDANTVRITCGTAQPASSLRVTVLGF